MRSMWKGAVSFGLVMIPVKLYAATETRDIAFRQVHREDGGRIRFRRFCTIDEQEVPYEDIAKGYELPDGEMVVLTDEDMAELPLPTTRNVEVVQFCPADQLDPILFNRSYYVEPEAAGTRAYCLLRDALEESGKIAIAQVALRQRESLAILRVRDGVLVLETLLWPDEVRVPDFGFLGEDIDVRPQELRMASSLIDSMTVDFDPDEYHDSYREAVQELVAAKTEGREVFQPETTATDTGRSATSSGPRTRPRSRVPIVSGGFPAWLTVTGSRRSRRSARMSRCSPCTTGPSGCSGPASPNTRPTCTSTCCPPSRGPATGAL